MRAFAYSGRLRFAREGDRRSASQAPGPAIVKIVKIIVCSTAPLVFCGVGCGNRAGSAERGGVLGAYAVRDLGPGRCLAISDDGLIAGFAETPIGKSPGSFDAASKTGAFLLSPDGHGSYVRSFLGKRDPKDEYSVVNQIRGKRLSGFTQGPYTTEAVQYDRTKSAWITLGALQPTDMTQATGLTSDGWVAGFDRTFPDDSAPFNHAVLYSPQGTIIDLGKTVTSALGGPRSLALAINDAGLVVGIGETGQHSQHAFAYDRTSGAVSDLGTLGGGSSEAIAVNLKGDIAGASDTASGSKHAFVRLMGTKTLDDVGTLGGSMSWAQALNDHGLVLGRSDPASGGAHPFVAVKQAAGWKLHDLFLDQTDLYSSMNAIAIDGKGEIVGDAVPIAGGDRHCILWSAK